jgi:hypothetical protein
VGNLGQIDKLPALNIQPLFGMSIMLPKMRGFYYIWLLTRQQDVKDIQYNQAAYLLYSFTVFDGRGSSLGIMHGAFLRIDDNLRMP